MRITTVMFDLDGTLLPMDQDRFVNGYFSLLAKKLSHYGYESDKLIKTVWAGTAAMVKNNGERSNEDVFWETFAGAYGERTFDDKPLFDEFYAKDFQDARVFCGFNPKASETVRLLKQSGRRVVLATNPLFPSVATESRIRWAGLEPDDFELYTTYENIGFCKPNTDYYREIVCRLGVRPDECLMIGNDVSEDMTALDIGINVFLLTDCLINKDGKDIDRYPRGSFEQLVRFIDSNG